MNFRITDDGNERDSREIHEMLKEYNFNHRETSKNVPIGVFWEDEGNQKLAGLTGETFGNWLCIQFFCKGTVQRQRNWKQVIGDCGARSKAARLQICFCGYLFISSPRILQKAWISGGFCPR